MTRHEKWVHERNLDEIVDKASELLVTIMLLSLEQITEQYLYIKPQSDSPDDISF